MPGPAPMRILRVSAGDSGGAELTLSVAGAERSGKRSVELMEEETKDAIA